MRTMRRMCRWQVGGSQTGHVQVMGSVIEFFRPVDAVTVAQFTQLGDFGA